MHRSNSDYLDLIKKDNMKYKKLIIIDLNKDINLHYDNALYVYLNKGKVNFKNSKKLYLDSIRKKKLITLKSNFNKALINKVNKGRRIIECFPELGFFNLRNDKDANYDLLFNILLINKYKKKKRIKETIVITDKEVTKDYFSNYKDNKVIYINKKFSFKFRLYRLKILKFYIKSFFVVLLAKLFSKKIKNNINHNDVFITLFPFFFKNKTEKFYDKNNYLKLNFLMGDEIHVQNPTLYNITKNLIKSRSKNLINAEAMISFNDLFKSYMKANSYFELTKKINFDLIIENHNFKKFYTNNINLSLLNRSKLEIYNNAIKKIVNLYEIKKLNLYLFEYSFGFYLIKQFKKHSKKIKIYGYQHGLFYKKLPWLDIITNTDFCDEYYPDYIYTFSKEIMNDYKSFFKQKKIKYILNPKKISEVAMKIKYNFKNNNNILIILGGHDSSEMIKILKDHISNTNYDKFKYFVKPHPKAKIIFNDEDKLFYVEKVNNMYFNKVVISPTSTVVYDMIKLKKPFYIFDIDYKSQYIQHVNLFKF